MSKEILQMKYHPAKKEVEFHRFLNGKEVAIRNGSKLMHYMNKKGQFVLQDYGNSFFDDIANVFDGLKTVDIQVITTKMDYEDFEQMVEYYNETPNNKCKINTTLLAELPDMKDTFKAVVKYGEDAIGILQEHRQKLFNTIRIDNDNVKKSAESFAAQIDEESKNIREKIESLNDTNVSLCFAGVYSTGKSSLINALLGYRILPEKISSETAKMFKIYSPKKDEKVKIIFDIDNVRSVLEWDKKKACFEFVQGPSESDCKTEIQLKVNEVSDNKLPLHEQICNILTTLNYSEDVEHGIEIVFPVALDSESVQFTIIDTPGSDSNYQEHQNVLMDALSEQKQSILIFVAAPNKIEGKGNEALFNYLKQAEEQDSKTSIDIGRSLFIINFADSTDVDDREVLQTQSIKYKTLDSDKEFSIKLADKKLFFTSAKYGYAANANRNKIANKKEESELRKGLSIFQDEFSGYCYRQNRCATSEFATNRLIEKCEEVLAQAIKKNDDALTLEVCCGIYAIQKEIKQYGEKYASAVKAFAIIDSVNKALNKLCNRADSLKGSNQEEIREIEDSIAALRMTINETIEAEFKRTSIPENTELPQDVLKRLKLDAETIHQSIVGNMESYMDKTLKKWFFGKLGKVKVREKDKNNVKNEATNVINGYTEHFLIERKKLLEEKRDAFMSKVKQAIIENGNISNSAKKFFQDVPEPRVETPKDQMKLSEIYDAHKRTKEKLWFKSEYFDKDGFIKDVKELLRDIVESMEKDYRKDYRTSLETLLMQIKSKFTSNLDEYSVLLSALIEDKDAMIELGNKVSDAADALHDCENRLNDVIWREIENV